MLATNMEKISTNGKVEDEDVERNIIIEKSVMANKSRAWLIRSQPR